MDDADRLKKVLARGVLQQEAGGAGAQGAEDVLVEVEGRQHEDARRGVAIPELRRRLFEAAERVLVRDGVARLTGRAITRNAAGLNKDSIALDGACFASLRFGEDFEAPRTSVGGTVPR